jgi:hypothetical protein
MGVQFFGGSLMAKVTWEVAEPRPNPFEAVVGDFREYANWA